MVVRPYTYLSRIVADLLIKSILMICVLLVSLKGYADSMSHDGELASIYNQLKLKGVTHSGRKFEIVVNCDSYEVAKANIETDKLLEITDGFIPICVVTEFSLMLQNQRLVIPELSYMYMADVHMRSITVKEKGGVVIVRVRGGDGVAAYDSSFYFDSEGLRYKASEVFDQSGDLVVKKEFVRDDVIMMQNSVPSAEGTVGIF